MNMIISKLKKSVLNLFLSVIASSALTTCPENEFDKNEQMPFKIGFEFQESKKRCKWALKDEYAKILKKPLFTLEDENTKKILCTVVIDDGDIEFITDPFSFHDKQFMNLSLTTIQNICTLLNVSSSSNDFILKALQSETISKFINNKVIFPKIKNALKNSEVEGDNRYFTIFFNWLKFKNYDEETIQLLWNNEDDTPAFTIHNIITISKIEKNLTTFREWTTHISSEYSYFNIHLNQEFFFEIENQPIDNSNDFTFKPQVTIQFPLQYTIPLFFNLYNFSHMSPILEKLVGCLPLLDRIQSVDLEDRTISEKANEYFTKLNGLIFLNALTLAGITSNNEFVTLITKIHERFEHTRQVDAKGTLDFMSRRPFSEMWKEIRGVDESFYQYFLNVMRENILFKDRFFSESSSIWATNIFPNYGQQFINNDGPIDLSSLIDENYFSEKFYEIILTDKKALEYVKKFLSNGIVLTTMINHFNPQIIKISHLQQQIVEINVGEIFTNFYQQTLQSIDNPISTYLFDSEKCQIIDEQSDYDRLSPPIFLNKDDSMGAYKESDKYDISQFGEAIIEFRQIDRSPIVGAGGNLFLSHVNTIAHDAETLFEFLTQITWNRVLQNDYKRLIVLIKAIQGIGN